MTLRIFIFGIVVLALGAISVWAEGLQITTTAIPSDFAFTSIELVQDKEELPLGTSSIKTAETYSRPLFSGNRRPFQAAEKINPDSVPELPVIVEEEPPVIEAERPRLKLLGTEPIAKVPSALITTEETGASSWFQQGDLVAGWRIIKIGIDDVALSNENDQNLRFNISLYPDRR